MSLLHDAFQEHQELVSSVLNSSCDVIEEFALSIFSTLKNGNKIFWCGNGGSNSDALHLSAELVGRLDIDRAAFASVPLSSDTTVMTALANDFGFESVYSRQLEALASPSDLLIVLSTSGNSTNIIKALTYASEFSMKSLAFLGRDGGRAISLASSSIVIPSSNTARVQEIHILIGHCVCAIVQNKFSD